MKTYDPLQAWWSIHGDTATSQGWDLFDTDDGSHSPIELQADDGEEVFTSDAEAWVHVVERAQAGDIACASALHLLAVESPGEYVTVLAHWATEVRP